MRPVEVACGAGTQGVNAWFQAERKRTAHTACAAHPLFDRDDLGGRQRVAAVGSPHLAGNTASRGCQCEVNCPPVWWNDEPAALLTAKADEIKPACQIATVVDQARLVGNINAVLPVGASALLSDVISMYPLDLCAAEIVGYLAIDDETLTIEMDDEEETLLQYADPTDPTMVRRTRLPKVTVSRR